MTCQVIETLNPSLTVPYVNFNFGGVENYPSIELFKPDTKNIDQVIRAVEVLGDKGLKVKADEIREMLGLTKPDKEDETVGGKLDADRELNSQNSKANIKAVSVSLNSENNKDDESMLENYKLEDDYIAIEDDIADTLKKAMESSNSFETLQKELERLASSWPVEKTAKLMTLAFFTRLCT